MARELLCLDDIDRHGRECPDALTECVQDLYHRLLETPSSNPDDPDRGLGLEDQLSGPSVTAANLEKLIDAECERSPQVQTCTSSVTTVSNGNAGDTTTCAITITPDLEYLNAEQFTFFIVRDSSGLHLVLP